HLDPEDYAEQASALRDERSAAQKAVLHAQDHVETVEQSGPVGDAEQALLDLLAALKQAVRDGLDAAPDLPALRNVIGQLFESVELVAAGSFPDRHRAGFVPLEMQAAEWPTPTLEAADSR